MIRHLIEIQSSPTFHSVGQKREQLSNNESSCSFTQIAATERRAGEVATAHIHPDI